MKINEQVNVLTCHEGRHGEFPHNALQTLREPLIFTFFAYKEIN